MGFRHCLGVFAGLTLVLSGACGAAKDDSGGASGLAPGASESTAAGPSPTLIPELASDLIPTGSPSSTPPSQTGGATQPSPTATSAVTSATTGIRFVFGEDLPDGERLLIQEALEYARSYYSQRFGVRLDALTLFSYSNVDEIVEANRVWYNLSPAAVASVRTTWATATATGYYRVIFNLTSGPEGDPVRAAAYPFQTLSHEFFHAIENELIGEAKSNAARSSGREQIRLYGPTWLFEGSADLFGWLSNAQRTGSDWSSVKAYFLGRLRGRPPTALRDLSTNQGFQSFPGAYLLSALAVEYLTRTPGQGTVVEYYRLIGMGAAWPDAFMTAFGISVDDFYGLFEAYRTKGFSD